MCSVEIRSVVERVYQSPPRRGGYRERGRRIGDTNSNAWHRVGLFRRLALIVWGVVMCVVIFSVLAHGANYRMWFYGLS